MGEIKATWREDGLCLHIFPLDNNRQELVGTPMKKELLTYPGLFFISHSTRERLRVQGPAELLLNYERARERSGSGEEAICKV
jgi:hypothetical protein